MENFKKLTREEMKKIQGGIYPITCWSSGSGGPVTSWTCAPELDMDDCMSLCLGDAYCQGCAQVID